MGESPFRFNRNALPGSIFTGRRRNIVYLCQEKNGRNDINRIDSELVRLFEERMHVTEQVASYKRKNGLPVFDAAREAANIERTSGMISDPALKEYSVRWYQMTMDLSKEYQKRILQIENE